MVHAIGESLYDLTFQNSNSVWACPGGSMLNSAVSLSRKSVPVRFYTEIGNDKTGNLLIAFLRSNRIITDSISIYNGKTSLALAFLDAKGDAEYDFYSYRPELPPDFLIPLLEKGDIMLFGSTYARQPRNQMNISKLAKRIKQNDGILIYDPNFRATADNRPDIIDLISTNIGMSDIVRGSDQDFYNLIGASDGPEAYRYIQAAGAKILIYTRNSEGVELFTPWFSKIYEVPEIKVVSTIGAGDNFNAGLISALHKVKHIPEFENFWDLAIHQAIIFASEVCASSNNFVDWPDPE
jgi:fructokinase